MSRPRSEDWELLGLSPTQDEADVHRAYHRQTEIYRPGALATYTLLDDAEREAALDRIEAAYRRILAWCRRNGQAAAADETMPGPAIEADEPEPDLEVEPGAWLRFHRRRRNLTVDAVSLETKIRPGLITSLEDQDLATLPASVFVRGFVVQYAKLLGARDPEDVARLYLSLVFPDD